MASIINASTTAGLVNTADTSGILQLQTANTTAVTVDASQNVTVVGSLTAAGLSGPHNGTVGATTPTTVVATTVKASTTMGVGGATPSTSGSGITFPATQSASTDANTLDDYEEGNWTPTCSNGSTYTGNYIKIGKIVHLYYESTSSGTISTASTNLTGLPFTSGGSSGSSGCGTYVNFGSTAAFGGTQVQNSTLYFVTASGSINLRGHHCFYVG